MEQIEVVHKILQYLLDKEALSKDPSTVEMKREGSPSVYPCRRGGLKLDISQIDWALKEGKWWFLEPIKQLKISEVKKEKLSQADITLLSRIAKEANFDLSMTFLEIHQTF